MKKWCLIFMSCLLLVRLLHPNIYFWESHRDGERSCCLFMSGTDICNPYVPCTRHAFTDLMGINDYIGRILQVDKGSTFSYHKILLQAQNFIRHALTSSTLRMYYRFDEYRDIKFYHEIQESLKNSEKPQKGSSTSSAATSDKQKNDEAVTAYLIKLGIARPIK